LLLDGRGGWRAGSAQSLLTADAMTALFGTPFVAWAGAAAPSDALLVQQIGRRPR
jgi:hypothetical protein